jgi:hypothetical protein
MELVRAVFVDPDLANDRQDGRRNVNVTGRTERSLGRMHLIPRISSVAAGGIYENRNLDDL